MEIMKPQDTVFYQKTDRIFAPDTTPLLMGILNSTPDSFFDGGLYTSEVKWLQKTADMIEAGADIIDIGAYSTRPGAVNISEEEELERLIPVIVSIRRHFPEQTISVDSFRASVVEKAVAEGADIINDISGGTIDKEMFPVVARLQVPYILMHIKGTPQSMQLSPTYENVVTEVSAYFEERIKLLHELDFFKIIIDPGFGFGKTLEHNFELFNNLEKFQSFNAPLLVGISRKSMIHKVLNISSKEALNGTTVLNTLALTKGASILRVHDVKEAKEVIDLYSYSKKY
jgi:dihydropteroate synthase